MILAIKTADSQAELFVVNITTIGSDPIELMAEKKWEAGRDLAHDLLGEIEKILDGKWGSLTGLIVFTGPGSFTGLRIGITTMNALANGLDIPIVGTDSDDWLKNGLSRLQNAENDRIVTPNYGAPANITQPKK